MTEQAESWPVGWESHRLAQLRRFARQPLWKKLLWLQEVNRVARNMRREAAETQGRSQREDA
jgi:hypothetical protein